MWCCVFLFFIHFFVFPDKLVLQLKLAYLHFSAWFRGDQCIRVINRQTQSCHLLCLPWWCQVRTTGLTVTVLTILKIFTSYHSDMFWYGFSALGLEVSPRTETPYLNINYLITYDLGFNPTTLKDIGSQKASL